MKIALVTDSTSDLSPQLATERQIFVVPQYVLWGTESFLDGIELKSDDFYTRLSKDKDLPKTSQPSPTDYAKVYREARAATNADMVICLTLSTDLSGTYNSAVQGASEVDFPVQVIDTRTVSLPLGFLVLTAADARDKGASAEEIIATVTAQRSKVQIYFTVATLEFLHRGGRVGAAKRFIGETLNIKPILYVEDGKVAVKESVRTRAKGIRRLLDLVAEDAQGQQIKRLGIVHGMALEEAQSLAENAKRQFGVNEVIINSCCSAIGVHVGPGVIALIYELV